jgi:hypothetical protein
MQGKAGESALRRFPQLVIALAIAIATAVAMIAAAEASAASITYVGSDGNVHLVSPDGSKKHQVTTDGSSSRPYESPTQTDDGTVVAIGFGGEYTKFAQFFDPATGTLKDACLLPDGNGIGAFAGLTGGHVSSDGAFYLFDLGDTRNGVRYATSLIGDTEVQDPCAIRCKYSWVSPRWAAGGTSLVIDPYFGEKGVGVQPAGDGDPTPWFNLTGDGSGDGVSSVDESAGKLALEYITAGSADSILDLELEKPTTGLVIATYSGAPGSSLPTGTCSLPGFSADPAYPRLSPDGSMLAWGGPEGIYVSPTPTSGDTCVLQPKLIAPGGERPDWGAADVPGSSGGGDDACAEAKEKLEKTKKALKRAKENGSQKKIERAKEKVKKAKAAVKEAC